MREYIIIVLIGETDLDATKAEVHEYLISDVVSARDAIKKFLSAHPHSKATDIVSIESHQVKTTNQLPEEAGFR